MQIAGLVFYIFSIFICFLLIINKHRSQKSDMFYLLLPIIFLLAQALYVLPLSIRGAAGIDFNSQLSPLYFDFVNYVPIAVLLTSGFNFIFVFFYVSLPENKKLEIIEKKRLIPSVAIIFLLIISLLMIYQVARNYGGLISYILLGYKVTETFAGVSGYVVAFNWLIVGVIVFLYSGYLNRDKKNIFYGILMTIILVVIFAIMGRRGALVVLVAAAVGGYHLIVRKIPLSLIFGAGFLFFLALNFIGLTRGESYTSFGQINGIMSERGDIAKNLGLSIFYTLIDGNFAVPFETFPQIIKGFGSEFPIGFGEYSLRGLSFLIPNSLWADRPLPLSNWYSSEFYGEDQLNAGRQFFILTAPYMDAGFFGVIFFGLVIALFLRWIARVAKIGRKDPLVLAGVIIFMASMLNFISNDLFGFMAAFIKTIIFPLLFLNLCRKIRFR